MAENVRNMTNVVDKAKDVKSTSQLTPNAKETADFSDTNKTVQYVAPDPNVSGAGGAENFA